MVFLLLSRIPGETGCEVDRLAAGLRLAQTPEEQIGEPSVTTPALPGCFPHGFLGNYVPTALLMLFDQARERSEQSTSGEDGEAASDQSESPGVVCPVEAIRKHYAPESMPRAILFSCRMASEASRSLPEASGKEYTCRRAHTTGARGRRRAHRG